MKRRCQIKGKIKAIDTFAGTGGITKGFLYYLASLINRVTGTSLSCGVFLY